VLSAAFVEPDVVRVLPLGGSLSQAETHQARLMAVTAIVRSAECFEEDVMGSPGLRYEVQAR
jgi:hypothetical protein